MVRDDMIKYLIKDKKLTLTNLLLTEFGKSKVDGITENEFDMLDLLLKDIDVQNTLENNKNGEFKEVSKDERRTIFANTDLLKGKEVSIIKLKEKKAIGGCTHSENEYWAIIDGEVIVSTGPENTVCFPGDAGVFPADIPHAFYALKESIIMEWGIEPSKKKNSPKDEEMLKRIQELNLK